MSISSVPLVGQLAQASLEQSKEPSFQDASASSIAAPLDPVEAIKALILQQDDYTLIVELEWLATQTKDLNVLLSMPQQVIHGEKYYLSGNCSYEEAQFRGFGERHNLAKTQDPVRWSFLNQASSPEDVIHLEGFPVGEKVNPSENRCETCELVLATKKCRGFEPAEAFEMEAYNLALQNTYKELREQEVRFSELFKSHTVTFLLYDDDFFARAWSLIKTPELESMLDLTISARYDGVRHVFQEMLHTKVTDELWNTISWFQKEIGKKNNESFKIRQQSLLQALETGDGQLKYVVAGLNHFPTPLNETDPLLESTRTFFASRKLCVLISEQIIADKKKIVEELKQEIIERFPSMQGKI